jgi:peptide/nickel transport system permease protein
MSALDLPPASRSWRRALVLDRGRHPILAYTVRRVGAGILTLLAISLAVFLATSVLPGDPASAILGRQATPANVAALRHQMGLDTSLVHQYLSWIGGLLHGDLGNSAAGYAAGGEVGIAGQISGKLGNSAILALYAFVPFVLLCVVLGVYSALREHRWQDHVIAIVTLIPAALPEFVFGALLLAVFFTWLDVLPPVSLVAPGTSPAADPEILVLPVLTLLGVTLGAGVRMVRAGMLDALRSETVTVARLNGLREGRVVRRYALRNALAPAVQVIALAAQYFVGGILIVEYLYAYPGIGKELVDAVTIHDNLAVQSITMLLAAIFVAITIVADLVVMLLVPRLRTGGA